MTLVNHTDENLLILCLDLFLAGSKTTTDTLASIFAFLASNPHHVKELQQELDSVLGRDRSPSQEDMPLLPKVAAFIAEVSFFHFQLSKNRMQFGSRLF